MDVVSLQLQALVPDALLNALGKSRQDVWWRPLLFWSIAVLLLILLFKMLLRRQGTSNNECKTREFFQGGSPSPTSSLSPSYSPSPSNVLASSPSQTSEETPTPSIYEDYTERVQAAIDRIQEDVGVLSEIGDQTCSIVKEVEEAYAGAKAGDVLESEFSLPKSTQAERRSARMEKARVQFARQRSVYHKMRSKTPVLECFQGDIEEAELQAAASELQTLLENEQVVASIEAAEQVGIALQFTNSYLDKNLPPDTTSEGFQPSSASAVNVDAASLRGQALVAHTIQLLNREHVFHTQVTRLRELAQTTRSRIDVQYQKAARVERGDIRASDLKDGLSMPK